MKEPAHVVIVPEQVRLAQNRSGMKNVLQGHLIRCQYRGGEYRLRVRIGDRPSRADCRSAIERCPSGRRPRLSSFPLRLSTSLKKRRALTQKPRVTNPSATVELTKLEEKIA